MLAILYQLFQVVYASLVYPKSFEGVPQQLFTLISQKLAELLLDQTVKLLDLCLSVF